MDSPHILALSWNIQTAPELYWDLVSNPYAPHALARIAQQFPNESAADVIRALIQAEPENYNSVPNAIAFSQTQKLLTDFRRTYKKELQELPKDCAYDCLIRAVFETTDAKKIAHMYSQQQRRDIRVSIIDGIEQEHEPSKSRKWLLALFAGLCIVLLSGVYVWHAPYKQTLPIVQAKEPTVAMAHPIRIKIPSIQVDAAVQYVGLTTDGSMNVPTNELDVGWFGLGTIPGHKGSAVMAGHRNGENGLASVFADLHKLKAGDHVYVEDTNGKTTGFVVRTVRLYEPGYADDVFTQNDAAHLNLITCDGTWDTVQKAYTKRLVVFTDIIP